MPFTEGDRTFQGVITVDFAAHICNDFCFYDLLVIQTGITRISAHNLTHQFAVGFSADSVFLLHLIPVFIIVITDDITENTVVNSMIKRVDVYRNYELNVELNMNIRQFFLGMEESESIPITA